MFTWTAASTLLVFAPPFEVAPSRLALNSSGTNELYSLMQAAPRAIGEGALLSSLEFNSVWNGLFGMPPTDPTCGRPKKVTGLDSEMLGRDAFLVQERGFLPELCDPKSWFVASVRLDPCRVRHGRENTDREALQSCSQNGKYSEVRFVLQPVLKHDRGHFFPDAALHLAFSLNDISQVVQLWQDVVSKGAKSNWIGEHGIVQKIRKLTRPHDVSVFLSGPGLERWTFARLVFKNGEWIKDALPHGGNHESLSDAELNSPGIRTPRPAAEHKFTSAEFLDPLKTTPLQGSCVGCHLAQSNRAARAFRQFGWGLSGEVVVSERTRAESAFAARELRVLTQKSQGK